MCFLPIFAYISYLLGRSKMATKCNVGEDYYTKTKSENEASSRHQEQSMKWFTPMLLISQGLGMVAIVCTVLWTSHYRGGFAWTSDPSKPKEAKLMFNYHPLLMVIGFVVLQGNAMLIWRVFRATSRPSVKAIHGFLQLVSLILAIIAVVAAFKFHGLLNIPDMYSLHSVLGLITIILHGLQILAGFTIFLFPGGPPSLRAALIPLHRYLGAAIFVAVVANCLLGLTEKAIFELNGKDGNAAYSAKPAEGFLINFLGLVLVALGGVVTFLVVNPNYRRPADNAREQMNMRG